MEESGTTLRPDITSNMFCPVVLIIHDEPFSQTFRRALVGSGCRVEEVSSGEVALDLFQRLRPDLVILDLGMQGMEVTETCAKLRNLEKGRYTPILVLAGVQDEVCIHRVIEAGATDFLTRPVNAELLGYRAHYLVKAGKALEEVTRGEARHRLLKAAVETLQVGVTQKEESSIQIRPKRQCTATMRKNYCTRRPGRWRRNACTAPGFWTRLKGAAYGGGKA